MAKDTSKDLLPVAEYVLWHTNAQALSNRGLAKARLREAPRMGKLADLCEIAAERLSPGVVEAMATESEKQQAMPS